jgi:two-component system response regulator (stage 0 sporulation protein A)
VSEKITVLVADDNNDFTTTLSNYLEKEEEIEIIGIAKDGNEAYEMAVQLKPDILLLDIIMPHLDGLGVLEKLYELDSDKKPLCIILSAVGQDKITQKAINLGAQYYIVHQCISKKNERIKNLSTGTIKKWIYYQRNKKSIY